MRVRRGGTAFLLVTVLAALPAGAEDRRAVARAVVDLTRALEGGYGDEGPLVLGAIEGMAAALAAWDGRLHDDEARVTAEVSRVPPAIAAQLHAAMGAAWYERGHRDRALAALDRAIATDPTLAAPYLLRGQVRLADDPDRAIRDFERALARDGDSFVAAYWIVQAAAAPEGGAAPEGAVAALAAAYRQALASGAPPPPLFPETHLLSDAQEVPVFAPGDYGAAYAALTAGDYNRALEQFREAAAGDPLLHDGMLRSDALRQGIPALRGGDLTTAATHFAAAAADMPLPSSALRLLALALRAAGQVDESLARLETAVTLDRANERAWLDLVSLLQASGDHTRLDEVLARAVEAIPASGALRWAAARRLGARDRGDAMRAQLEAISTDRMLAGRGHVWTVLGQLYLVAMRLEEATETFRRSVLWDPNSPRAHILLGEVYRTEGHDAQALAAFVAAALLAPELPDAHTGVGQIHLATGRFEEAAQAFRHALTVDGGHAEAHYGLAQVLQRTGAAAAASSHFERYRRLQHARLEQRRRQLSTSALAREARLHDAAGRYDEAIATWRLVVEREPGDPAHYRGLAEAHARAGDVAAAVEVLEALTRTNPDPAGYRRLSELYYRLERYEESARARDAYAGRLAGTLPSLLR